MDLTPYRILTYSWEENYERRRPAAFYTRWGAERVARRLRSYNGWREDGGHLAVTVIHRDAQNRYGTTDRPGHITLNPRR